MAPKPKALGPSQAGPSKRRHADLEEQELVEHPQKVNKVHPFFTSKKDASTFHWISPSLGPQRTCLYAVNLAPKIQPRVAAFDLDGTLINNRSKKSGLQWEWWRTCVPNKLKEVHESGFSIVIISNQALRTGIEEWQRKVSLIASSLPDVPFRLFAARAKDGYRKPIPGMWYELERIFTEEKVTIDKASSFFVGDAAGRVNDFASTDRKWAENVGITFFTPEEYFLNLPAAPYSLPGFQVSTLPQLPFFTPTSTSLLQPVTKTSPPELVLFVGYPCLGKTTLFRRYFEVEGYVHVNQDILGTRPKCIAAVTQCLQKGKSCVVDNTNRDSQTRHYYTELAKKHGTAVRCILFNGSMELAWHNNLYRAFNMPPSAAAREPKRDLVPWIAFTSFRDNYEEPLLSEGFAEIKRVNWVFEGDEEERRRWNMWLQIDGK